MGFVSSPLRVTGRLAPEGEPWPLVCLQPEPAAWKEVGGPGGKAAGQPPQASPPSWPTCALVRTCLSVGEERGYHGTGHTDNVQGPAIAVLGRIMAVVTGRRWYGETAGSGHRLLLMSEPAIDSGTGVGCW